MAVTRSVSLAVAILAAACLATVALAGGHPRSAAFLPTAPKLRTSPAGGHLGSPTAAQAQGRFARQQQRAGHSLLRMQQNKSPLDQASVIATSAAIAAAAVNRAVSMRPLEAPDLGEGGQKTYIVR
eukprot:CAMPEP_0173409270 /NCGR_PEP_ID=MMETSP1356-20130122/71783_1 /TAXON_ID=77927 ORGANISM="Hemiselmis virescens, Strain PCC157" /NCGR_SAMPLE_ID=MMETSP1356 /ASSEMBLY_ACC=CAM_ASM_000847 /LENGTH=125 /DNA_ID=CAMNT_0014370709 /DNA_START=64 /DNA_END=438 /DNA_ORIENTATION=-